MKSKFKVLVATLALGAFLSGCFGSFGATRWLYKFNDSFDNKFVKTLIMWVFLIIPAYELFLFADFWIINLIEFWTGSNPVGAVKYDLQQDGSMLVQSDAGDLRYIPIDATRVLVERDGAIVGEMAQVGETQVQLTDYASATVRLMEIPFPAM